MRHSLSLIPTLRDAPADAEVLSHKLMMRAGYIRKLAAGVYSYLPLAHKVFGKIKKIIEEEMTRVGAQQVSLPIVMPAELWLETGRWNYYGKELLRFKDRHDRDFCIGPTHEEAMTDLVRHTVNSYRQLPINLYQIQNKFRDEVRPRYGLMRGREFIMKDGYSFHVDEASCMQEYEKMGEAYTRIFQRCGLKFRAVEAVTGNIGGTKSHEYQVLAGSGEDIILSCNTCHYAANVEKAALKRVDTSANTITGKFQKVSTPGQRSIEEVSVFLKVSPQQMIKTLIYKADNKIVAALVRGDHELMEAKLKNIINCAELVMASEAEIMEATGGPQGFSGPIGLTIPVYADYAIAAMSDGVTGANTADLHYTQVNAGDFKVVAYEDLRRAVAGDACVLCADGKYEEHRGIEVGQIFFLGTKYSAAMKAEYNDEKGQMKTMVMGTYGIGVSRTAAAAIEQNHDENGIIWPLPIAPYQVHLISLDVQNAEVMQHSEAIYQKLTSQGIEVLWDERDLSPGMKFKDSDLIGIPHRIVIGSRGLKDGVIELKDRKTGAVEKLSVEQCLDKVSQIMNAINV